MNIAESFVSALKDLDLPIIPDKSLTVLDRQEFISADEARTWLNARLADKVSGWAQFSDCVCVIREGTLAADPEGILLAAELHGEEDKPCHRIRSLDGAWIAVTIGLIDSHGAAVETVKTKLNPQFGAKIMTHQVSWSGSPLSRTLSRLTSIA